MRRWIIFGLTLILSWGAAYLLDKYNVFLGMLGAIGVWVFMGSFYYRTFDEELIPWRPK